MDCLDGLKKLEENSIDLVVTDPPYGIDYQSSWMTNKRFDKIKQDKTINTYFLKEVYRALKQGSGLYVFTRWDVYPQWLKAIKSEGFIIKNCIVWDRLHHGLGDLTGSYAPQHDFIIFAIKGRHLLKKNRPKDIIRCKRPDVDKMTHPTEKPTKLIKQLVNNSSNEGDIILDPFMGSGTTAVCCKQLNRRFIGFEIERKYVDVANKRLQQSNLSNFMSF